MGTNETKRDVEKYYDQWVKQFTDERLVLKEKMMRPLYEKVIESAEINNQTTVGIVGSSTGSMPLFMASRAKAVIGIDLSAESLRIAERRTRQLGVKNIEYKKGDAEVLPLEENSVDVVLSDCVVNLVPDKQKAFNEMYRILRKGGLLVIADPVRRKKLPLEASCEPVGGCIKGTVTKEEYEQKLAKAGFENIAITNITDLARKVFALHQDKFDKYSLNYVILKARKPKNESVGR